MANSTADLEAYLLRFVVSQRSADCCDRNEHSNDERDVENFLEHVECKGDFISTTIATVKTICDSKD